MSPCIDTNPRLLIILKCRITCNAYSPQNHRGLPISQEMWVFGLADTSHTPAVGYMQVVNSRSAATLLPLIQVHVAPGTIIHSDQWSAYSRVTSLPNVSTHDTVNDSIEFVNRTSYWSRSKTKLKRRRRCRATELPSYFDEFMWRERYGKTAGEAFRSIMADIASFYPVDLPPELQHLQSC